MKLLRINIATWYKSMHVFFACAWFGGVLSVIVIYLLTPEKTSQEILINNSLLMERIDQFIIIPSSLLCYFLGLLISWKTNWGFFKYKWVVAKLVIGTALILFGAFFLAPWLMDANSTQDMNHFKSLQNKLGISMIVQAIVIAVTIVISTTKPWGKVKTK